MPPQYLQISGATNPATYAIELNRKLREPQRIEELLCHFNDFSIKSGIGLA
jgi:hypothetical protein